MIHFTDRDVDVASETAIAMEQYKGRPLIVDVISVQRFKEDVKGLIFIRNFATGSKADVVIHANWISTDVIPERCRVGDASFIAFGRLDRQDNKTIDSMFKPQQ